MEFFLMGRKRRITRRKMVEDFTSKYTVKSQQDLQEAMRDFFDPVLQSFLEAEMDTKLGYEKN